MAMELDIAGKFCNFFCPNVGKGRSTFSDEMPRYYGGGGHAHETGSMDRFTCIAQLCYCCRTDAMQR